MNKIILDLCGGTGSWSKPYKDAGYDVRNITLPEYDILDYMPDKPNEIYGILAAPPCTMFSFARTNAKTPRDFVGAMEIVKACLNIIWICRLSENSKLKFWALENPKGYLRQFLGKPPFTFSPEDFGDNYTKQTDLWGFYNIPVKKPYKLTTSERMLCAVNNRVLPELPDDYVIPAGWNKQAAKRAITPAGFAEAFFKANK